MPASARCHSSIGSPFVVHKESLAVLVHDQLVTQLLVHEVPRVDLVLVPLAPSCSHHPTLRHIPLSVALAVLGSKTLHLLHELVPLKFGDLVLLRPIIQVNLTSFTGST